MWTGKLFLMKIRPGKLLGIAALLAAVLAALCTFILLQGDHSGPQVVAETRRALREQGFKTELAEFNFSTTADFRAREAALTSISSRPSANFSGGPPDLLPTLANNSAIVVWQQDWLPNAPEEMQWHELHDVLDPLQFELDAACAAALSGPIRFNLEAGQGSAMLLRPLAPLKNLTQSLGSRTVLELHEGRADSAWTNVLAATRLVTAWDTEPVDISHMVRFACVTFAYNAAWQALQTNGWSDKQLARLQREWESVDFFKGLPETAAFKRASTAAMCQRERQEPLESGFTAGQFFKEALSTPRAAWGWVTSYGKQLRYRNAGSYEDEKALLLFYRDRELELRRAIQTKTWAEMRTLPGVTNRVMFLSNHSSRMQSILNMQELGGAFQRGGMTFLGRAVQAEAQRRLLVTALALARHHTKHGAYPQTLAELAPEFVTSPPVDFMDGQPMRYQRTDDGHFALYSVGLDGVDNGGHVPSRDPYDFPIRSPRGFGAPQESDLVWPRPASAASVAARHRELLNTRALQANEVEAAQANARWDFTARRQAEAPRLLAREPERIPDDLKYFGRPLAERLRNGSAAGTNQITLQEMFTLRQVLTGAEPETITFDAPIRFTALTNLGMLALLIDVTTNGEDLDEGCGVSQMECQAAPNGDCRLTWSTLYEAPGQHALQLALALDRPGKDTREIIGPVFPCVVTNLCQFSLGSAMYDPATGAILHARLPEPDGVYTAELTAENGNHLKTFTGTTTNGSIKIFWNLVDDQGRRLTGETFNSTFHVTLPGSGRSQTLKGP